MPFVSYFAKRVGPGGSRQGLTVADCVDLIFQSTVTHVDNGGGWNALPHPPHPHAHTARDGFHHQLTTREANDLRSLAGNPRMGPRGTQRLQALQQRSRTLQALNLESRHLDPAIRGTFDPQRQVVDPHTPYINRNRHSQFEDGEVAAMALYYLLLSPAGYDALQFLSRPPRRAVIQSVSAGNALNGPAIPYKDPPPQLSQHPRRHRGHRVVERGRGSAGAAPVPRHPVASVTAVLDSDVSGRLTLTTLYPARNGPGAQDRLERKRWAGNHWANAVPPATVPPAGAQPDLVWSEDTPARGWLSSSGTGRTCRKCAAVHGSGWSGPFGRWHRCRGCGAEYCPNCGDALVTVSFFSRERRCAEPACSGTTQLVS